MGKLSAEIVPGALDLLILQTLTGERMHGQGIAESIRLVSDDMLHIEEGPLYPVLQRLTLKGWVTATWGKSEDDRSARYYQITGEGRQHLSEEVREFERALEAIFRVLRPD